MSSKRFVSRAAVVAVLLGSSIGGSAASANEPGVGCGEVIVTDTKLEADLHCPVGDGIVIGAPNITLDLGGHVLSGSWPVGSPHPVAGVDNTGFDGVTIKDGKIRGFGQAVELSGASGNTVRKLEMSENSAGITLLGSDNNVIAENDFRSMPFYAFTLGVSSNNLIVKNHGFNTGGIQVGSGANNVVRENEMSAERGWKHPTSLFGNGDGIGVFQAPVNTLVERNITNGNSRYGIRVQNASTTLAENVANDNGDLGINAESGAIDGGGNEAAGNGNPAQCAGVSCNNGT